MAPVQIRGTVLTLRRVDAYHALTLVAPAIATRFRPGPTASNTNSTVPP